jgi:hypothetical protein
MGTDRCGNPRRQKCAKGIGKVAKIQALRYTTNVEYETSDYTSNYWIHRNINKRFKENLEVIWVKH